MPYSPDLADQLFFGQKQLSEIVTYSSRPLVSGSGSGKGDDDSPARTEAEDFLREMLASGSRPAKEIDFVTATKERTYIPENAIS
jgi:hypothetical protein